ncbi:Lysozyme-like domain containing protein [Naviculisporaceae sp. PSN 640]
MSRSKILSLAAAIVGVAQVQGACIGPPVNAATINLVKSFEGWVPDIYPDPDGNPTVGYGHLCANPQCSDVPYPIPLFEADGERLLRDDITTAQQCITLETADPVTLNDNQYGALVSWAFNVGWGNVASSDLIKHLNEGQDPNTVAAAELPRWKYGNGGVVLPGLERRRIAEVDLFRTPSNVPALPVVCT